MKITIEKNKVFNLDALSTDWERHANRSRGEHYSLLCYMSKKFNNSTIIDAGTWSGWSAISLAQNPLNKVKTYDIVDKVVDFKQIFYSYSNIERVFKDINTEDQDVIKSSPLILLDIDPHDGVQETKFTNYLSNIGYEGYVLCDDIHLNEGMSNWWQQIILPKYDLTNVGHYNAGAGTGLICFGNCEVEIVEFS